MTRAFIAIPSIGVVDTRFAISLASLRKPPGMALAASPRSMPDIARNGLFDQAVKFKYDYVFFLDDDMILDAGTLVRLQEEMDSNPSIDVLSVMAFRRHPPFHPCVLRKMEDGTYDPVTKFDCGVIEVDATHFAATLVRVSTLSKIPAPRFEFKLQDQVKGEDIVLSEKLAAAGAKIFCDTSIEALHIGIPQLVGRKTYELARTLESKLVTP